MKKILVAAAVVFVVKIVLDFIVHGLLMGAQYEATKDIWRPDMMDLMWISYVINLVVALCLSWIYSKGYENKGVVEGVRFGVVVGLMMSIGMGYGTYMTFNIPYSMAIQWFLYGIISYIVIGVALALVFKQTSDVPPASA
jgi:hypothetical protein